MVQMATQPRAERSQRNRRGRTRHTFDHAAYRATLATNEALNSAIRRSVEAELLAREVSFSHEMAQHPRTVREERRRADARRIQKEREKRRIFHALHWLARKWRARLVIDPRNWILDRAATS